MLKVTKLTNEEKHEMFFATAINMGLQPALIEKDYWVCFVLDHLFHDSEFKEAFVFKGGTSLSKSYHVIKRFSEDIDLILDWRKIINNESNPWDDRSKTKQDSYNKWLNKEAAAFYKDVFVPKLNDEFVRKLGNGNWLEIDERDEMVINFLYPRIFETNYIVPHVRLEIGPLAEWTPSHKTIIEPFVATEIPNFFKKKNTEVLTIDVERTFWEKITILHKIANFPNEKILPHRYARHLYDVYCLGNSYVKKLAFNRKELLERDVIFKQKFYYSKGAHYETATLKTVNLIPKDNLMNPLREDYDAMKNMLYGDYPSFDEIIKFLAELEEEIHNL